MKNIAIKNERIDLTLVPEKSGVYIFISKNSEKLYIGKAKNLRSRLRSYFLKDFPANNPQKANLISESKKVQVEVLESEIEALVKESFLIKKFKPKYNIIFKDDKNYFFVGFTNDAFPKIIISHQTKIINQILKSKAKSHNSKSLIHNSKFLIQEFVGPFVSGRALKITLKTLRKIFPYCTCLKAHKRPCLNSQIGLCNGVCCLSDAAKFNFQWKLNFKRLEYKKNISAIKRILTGKSKKLLRDLRKEMISEAENENFEKAEKVKNKIAALEKVLAHKKIFENDASGDLISDSKITIANTKIDFSKVRRIEAFDISIFHGKNPVGSMIVFQKNSIGAFIPQKSQYRKFKIRNIAQNNDPAMMGQIIKRRFAHLDWPLPELVLIDGGKAQLNETLKNYKNSGINKRIIFIALAKREELVYTVNNKAPVRIGALAPHVGLLFQAVRDEAHRFAINFHKNLREKSLYV